MNGKISTGNKSTRMSIDSKPESSKPNIIGAADNSRIVEEPCAVKMASTVLNGRVTG
jgi:hypothetical protein